MTNESDSLSPATRMCINIAREDLRDGCDIDDGRAELPDNAEDILTRLVLRALEAEYPYGQIGDAIRAEAACKPHTQQWCYCRDAVIDAVDELADAIRAAKEQTNGDE